MLSIKFASYPNPCKLVGLWTLVKQKKYGSIKEGLSVLLAKNNMLTPAPIKTLFYNV